MNLDTKETALVLAGLRLLQAQMEGGDRWLSEPIKAILDEADVGEGAVANIDSLCERINVVPNPSREFPFVTPIRINDGRFLRGYDSELILEAVAYTDAELAAIVQAVNARNPLLSALEKCRDRLANWAAVNSDTDEQDQEALDEAKRLLGF